MNAQWLLGWWNLIFILPFSLALLYLGVYTLSGVTFGDPGADADLDGDAHLDPDAEVHVDADADADMDAEADADHDADAESAHGGGGAALLAWLGVGRAPVSVIAMVFFLTWGVAGFAVNQILRPSWRGSPQSIAGVSIPLAAIISLALTRIVVALMARYLPMNETTARRRHELLGSIGEAMFPIDERFGMASVREAGGDLFQVPCRLEATRAGLGHIPKGARVLLTGYSARQRLFLVVLHDAASVAGDR